MSKGARVRQKRVQAPQQRSGKRRSQAPLPPGQGGSRRNLYIGVIGAAVLLAVILVGASVFSSSSSSPKSASISSAADTNKLLAGIHQGGIILGNPKAPVTMYEFADLQCPGCQQYMTTVFPDIVRRYVRPGKVKIQFNGIAFIGPDSEKALRFAQAAGQQNKLFNVAELLYRNQGVENSGWVTDAMLRSVADAVPGLDYGKVQGAVNSKAVNRRMAAATNAYSTYNFSGTPGFAIGPTGGTIQLFNPSAYSIEAFAPTFDKILKQQSKQ